MNSTNNTFLRGHSIELRVPSDDDIKNSNWHSWYNDQEITRFNSHGIYPISTTQEIGFIENTMSRKDTILCSIYDLKTEKIIGNAALQNIDLINRHCNIALMIGEAAPFTAAVETYGLLCHHAFMRLNLEGVHDATHEKLRKLVNMLSVIGFKEEGLIEKYFNRDNCWYSKIMFGIMRTDFIELSSQRRGHIIFDNIKELKRAIIDSVK
jgi:ribosomal-protein-alanine N-acetyltransferase